MNVEYVALLFQGIELMRSFISLLEYLFVTPEVPFNYCESDPTPKKCPSQTISPILGLRHEV